MASSGLKVVTAKPGKLGPVTTNPGGLQGGTYNPQPAAPGKIVQNPTYNPQPVSTRPIQGGSAAPVQQGPTAAQIQAAAAIQQAAAVAEAARQREVVRTNFQIGLNTKVAGQQAKIVSTMSAPAFQSKLTTSKTGKLPKITYQKYEKTAYDKAYEQAMSEYNAKRKAPKTGLLGTIADKLTFGQDRRDAGAREWAEKRAGEIMDTDFKGYEKKVNSYLSKQAQAQAAVNSAATKISQADYEKFVATQQAALDSEYSALVRQATEFEARTTAFSDASKRPLTSLASRGISKAVQLAGSDMAVWKYTLGSGSKNIPSLVTAPSRAVNFFGNLNTQDRTVYKTGGGSTNRKGSDSNAWQATHGQRNFNIKPSVDRKFNKAQAEKEFGIYVSSIIAARKAQGYDPKKNPDKFDRDALLRGQWDTTNERNRFQNSALELAADPLNVVGGATAKFGSKLLPKISQTKFVSSITNNKAFKWLNAEHKTPDEQLRDAITLAKSKQDDLHRTLLPRINALNHKLNTNEQLDTSIFDDFNTLTDWEAKIVQRAGATGSLSRRDVFRLAGNKSTRQKLETVAAKWADFSKKMAAVDQVGGSKSKLYIPYTGWVQKKGKTLDDYDFRMHKTKKVTQNAADLRRSAIDRYFKSNIDETHALTQGERTTRRVAERDELLRRFDDDMQPLKDSVDTAYKRTRTVRARAGKVLRNVSPNAIWKKSVLKYRPAWYVNNALYNTQAAMLAGGARAGVEQIRMLQPKYWRKAMDEVPEAVKSNLAKEVGRDKLARFGSRLENWSRVAAFRGAKSKGLDNAAALKRVDNYLFDYKTKNWERPIKAVVPFWAFQKNLFKAAARMPFDRPGAAIGYNRLDQYQQQQFDRDFDKTVPELEKAGYSDDEIKAMRAEQAKYFRGRLKVGSKYITTPFNAFSEKQMSHFGINPYMSAGREVADSVDEFGRSKGGRDTSFMRRLASKFPQVEIGRQAWNKYRVDTGKFKPSQYYIGKAGSDGFGMGKEKQGYDSKAKNYVPSLDPRQKFGQNIAAFGGVPRSMTFDKDGFVKGKVLQKVSETYFATDWKGMEYEQSQAQQAELFMRFGITADEFFKGVLSKYDTANTTRIKGMKEDARQQNQALLDEYGKQPAGTRNMWAANKLKELVASNYYGKNPYLYAFDWLNPTSMAKADRQQTYLKAKATGDWSAWRNKYGDTRSEKSKDREYAVNSGDWSKWRAKYGSTEKQAAREKAVATGDWSEYRTKYGAKETPHKFEGKFFKTAESMEKYKEGMFWSKYAAASKDDRKKLLADNPQFNTRGGWTAKQWTDEKRTKKAAQLAAARGVASFASSMDRQAVQIKDNTIRFNSSKGRRVKKLTYNFAK